MKRENDGARKLLSLILSGAGDLLRRIEEAENTVDQMQETQRAAALSRKGESEWPVPDLRRWAKSLTHPRKRYFYNQMAEEFDLLRSRNRELENEIEQIRGRSVG